MTSLAGEDEMNTFTPCVMGGRGGEEAGEPVCAVPGRPAPPTKSAVSVTRVSDSRGERGEDRRGMGGRGGWRRRRWKGGMG